MKIFITAIILTSVLILSSCGEKVQEMKQAADNLSKIAEAGNNMEAGAKLAEAKKQERIKKGDTLAMPYKKLQEYLPASISGYTPEDPTGETMNMGMSFSHVTRRYVKGNDYINIEIFDYNQAYELYQGITALWATGISIETDKAMERTYKTSFDNVVGYEKFDKISKTASLTCAVAWRFIIVMEANNQPGTDFTKSIFNSMKIKELSAY
jgi:hypothetical protein